MEPDEFDYSFRIATILYNQKDKLSAIRELSYFLDQEPSPQISFFYSLYIAKVLTDLGKYEEAIETVKSLQKDYHILGMDIGVSSVIGLANALMNNPIAAQQEVDKLMQTCHIYQLCFIADEIRFVSSFKQGKNEEAFRYFESAIETQQDSFNYAGRFRSLIPADYLPRYEELVKKSKEIFRKKRYRFF